MAINFEDFLNGENEPILHPRDIFFTLERNRSFAFPRDIQTEVMNLWFDDRDRRDRVIKLNVGSGKTLVGLLLLQSSINENAGPSLYISPNKQLQQQVLREAEALGIDVTEDPREASYQAGERICLINVYTLFNGKSIFGVNSNQIDIGTVVIDDVHACVSTIADQFRIKLKNDHDAYIEIFQILSQDLEGHNEARFLDVKAGDPRAYMEVPFWSWNAHQSEILRALQKQREDEDLLFVYPLLSEILQQCRCFVGGQYLEIEPYFPATDIIRSFRRAKRRIYMTATLSDDSVIVTHFGADPNSLTQPIVPSSSQSMGERMILMPQELNPDLTLSDLKQLLETLSKRVNVVAIVPSRTAAKLWEDTADQILLGNDVVDGVEELRSRHVGLTVLVNRYDGIDLPDDACRVLAIVGLPEVSSYADLLDSEVLSHTSVHLRRHVERIEQGMGRGIRSNDDYCVVLLFGSKLTGRLRSPEARDALAPATRAQLDLARQIANRLDTPTIEEIGQVIHQCLDRDSGWTKLSRKILVNIQSEDQLRLDAGKIAVRKAFDFARANQYESATTGLDEAIDGAIENEVKALLLTRKAAFQHITDAHGAQSTLVAAHRLEPSVTRPMHAAAYRRIAPATGQQAAAVIGQHEHRFIDATAMMLYADELCSDLQFLVSNANRFEAAIDDLSRFLGIRGQRPEKEYSEGPDNLWALTNGYFLVIECKNNVEKNNSISKTDVAQLGQSVAWFKAKYPASKCIPIIVHPSSYVAPEASLIEGMRVIQEQNLEKLRRALRSFSRQLANLNVSAVTTEVAKRLSQNELNEDAFVNAFSVKAKKGARR